MTWPHSPLDEKDDDRELVREPSINDALPMPNNTPGQFHIYSLADANAPAPPLPPSNLAAADTFFGIFGFKRVGKEEEEALARKLDEERR